MNKFLAVSFLGLIAMGATTTVVLKPADDALPATVEAAESSVDTVAPAAPVTGDDRSRVTIPLAPDDARVEDSIARGLAFLALHQDPESGGWRQDIGYKFNDRYEVETAGKPHVGVSALALMAFIAGGHLPGRGRYGDVVERGTDFILSCVDEDTGYISSDGTRMYSHAFASLFLAEIYGMTRRADVHSKLQQAIDLTSKSQNRQGSWRYRPYAPDADMSITVCQLMALRAARNIGIAVPKSRIQRAYTYIENSAYPRGSRNWGAFKYRIDEDMPRISFALAAAGVASLIHAGYYDDDMISPGIRWLKGRLRNLDHSEHYGSYFYWYGHYYCAQVMFIADDQEPGLWDDFYWPLISNELVTRQRGDGSWVNRPGPGDVFSTAVASLILQIPYRFLPIFQR